MLPPEGTTVGTGTDGVSPTYPHTHTHTRTEPYGEIPVPTRPYAQKPVPSMGPRSILRFSLGVPHQAYRFQKKKGVSVNPIYVNAVATIPPQNPMFGVSTTPGQPGLPGNPDCF
jgi:hypothetical protein